MDDVDEDTTLVVNAANGVLSNDTDVDSSDNLTVTAILDGNTGTPEIVASDGIASLTETLTITITGTNDLPEIINVDAMTVSEEGLANGIIDNLGDPTDISNSPTHQEILTFTDIDNPDVSEITMSLSSTIADVYSDGFLINWNWNSNTYTLTGTANSISVRTIALGSVNINASVYSVDYTVNLLGPLDHPNNDTEDTLSINFGVNINDGVGNIVTQLNVVIEDDAPLDEVNELAAPSMQQTINGFITGDLFDPGADGFGSVNFEVITQGLQSNGINLTYIMNRATLTAMAGNTSAFTLQAIPDGTGHYDYKFTLLDKIDVSTVIDYDLGSGPAGNNAAYYVDTSGTIYTQDDQAASVIATMTGTFNNLASTINSNAHGIGVGPQTSIDTGEAIKFVYGIDGTSLAAISLGTNNNGNHTGTTNIQNIVTYSDNSTSLVNTTINGTLTIEELAQNGFSIVSIEIFHMSGNNFQINGLSSIDTLFNMPVDLEFAYGATDNDGDSVIFSPQNDGHFTLTLEPENLVPNALNNTYHSDQGADIVGNIIADDTGHGIDSDNDGDAEVAITGGTLFINENGSFSFEYNGIELSEISFTYTVNDNNGGSDTATVDLQTYSTETLNPENDNENGTDAHDIIISDVTSMIPGENYNIAFLIDTSGSMGNSRVTTAKEQIIDVLNSLISNTNQAGSGVVNVLLIDFDTSARTLLSVDLSDPDAITQITNALLTMSTGGYTNYYSAFTAALDWFQYGAPTNNIGTNQTYFITDGYPNRDGGLTGSALSNGLLAFNLLNVVSMVQAIGIGNGVNSGVLQQLDSDGIIFNNVNVNNLADTIIQSNQVQGDDTVDAGAGNDIIFGDLIDFAGISAQDMDALREYVAVQTNEDVNNITNADAHLYVSQNIDQFDLSQTNDGNDTLIGGTGDDILFGQGGDDKLYGDADSDILIGGEGSDFLDVGIDNDSDQIIWNSGSADGSTDIVFNFDISKDLINIADILLNEDDIGSSLDDYLDFSFSDLNNGTGADGVIDTVITIDTDGVVGGDTLTIILNNIDLSVLGGDDIAIINNLLTQEALLVDSIPQLRCIPSDV